ncbi:MAG: hypothetical protein SFV22_04160 [Saprospiraceae bacterium]|nr:hypothetical protein [Saprospiraceae bacterium]
MKNLFFAFAATLLVLFACGQPPVQTGKRPDSSILLGKWTYRSLLNSTDVNADFDSLEFAAATIDLKSDGKNGLYGQILWAIDSPPTQFNGLNLKGNYYYNDTTLCYYLVGIGDSTLGTAGWQYDYQGYLVPKWPEGVDQATVLVGSIVRVKKHSCDPNGQNCHPAGVVATTYMVKEGR